MGELPVMLGVVEMDRDSRQQGALACEVRGSKPNARGAPRHHVRQDIVGPVLTHTLERDRRRGASSLLRENDVTLDVWHCLVRSSFVSKLPSVPSALITNVETSFSGASTPPRSANRLETLPSSTSTSANLFHT